MNDPLADFAAWCRRTGAPMRLAARYPHAIEATTVDRIDALNFPIHCCCSEHGDRDITVAEYLWAHDVAEVG